jgi:hypothetical protein
MAHARCPVCMVRVWRDDAGAVCPECGGPLETVARAEELVGLRAVGTRRDGWSLADHVRETIARNDAARERRLHEHRRGERPS